MKRLTTISLMLVFVSLSFFACGPKAGAPSAGSASAEQMAAMFPKDAAGILVIDVHRAMQTEPAQKMIADKDNAPKYQEFVKETGIDLQKDVYFVAGALIGSIDHPEGAAIFNVRYNKDTLLAKLKDKLKEDGGELKESTYEGVTLYEIHPPVQKSEPEAAEKKEGSEAQEKAEKTEPQGAPAEHMGGPEKPGYGAFLDESNICVGTEAGVKAVIDVLKGKTESVRKNPEVFGLVKQADTKAMLWAVVGFPAETVKKMTESNPMLSSLAGVHSLILSFDYRDKAVMAELKLMNKDEAKNKQIADFLNGLKALGNMAGSQKPEVAELMNKIVITSAADSVAVTANIPEDLLNKLGEEAKKALPQMEKKEGEEPKTEK